MARVKSLFPSNLTGGDFTNRKRHPGFRAAFLIAVLAGVEVILGAGMTFLGARTAVIGILGIMAIVGYAILTLRSPKTALLVYLFLLPITPEAIGISLPDLSILLTVQRTMLAILFGITVIRFAERRSNLSRTSMDFIFILLFMVQLISLILSVSPARATISFTSDILEFYFSFYLIVFTLEDTKDLLKVAKVIIAGVFLTSLLGLYELVRGGNPLDKIFYGQSANWYVDPTYFGVQYLSLNRVHASFNHPIAFGWFLALGIPMIWLGFTLAKNNRSRFWYLGVGVLAVVALIGTLARSTYLGAAAGVMVLVLLTVHRGTTQSFLVLVVFLVVFLLPLMSHNVSDGLSTFLAQSSQLVSGQSLTGRLSMLQAGFQAWLARPFGYGLYSATRFSETGVFGSFRNEMYQFENGYLVFLLEMGWLGLLVNLGVLVIPLWNCWYCYRKSKNHVRYNFAVALMGSLVANAVVLAGSSYMGMLGQLVWVLFALSVILRKLVEQENNKPQSIG